MRNLLMNKKNPLHNRTLHISGTFKVLEKANIEKEKANIEKEKANIEASFSSKTASHVSKLLEKFGVQLSLADRYTGSAWLETDIVKIS